MSSIQRHSGARAVRQTRTTLACEPSLRLLRAPTSDGPAGSWTFASDAELRPAMGDVDRQALSEVYRRHGATAFNVALAITRNGRHAEAAVVDTFVELARGRNDGDGRPLRSEVLDATRRCAAARLDDIRPAYPPREAGGAAAASALLAPDVRDALALAIGGPCTCAEIADVLQQDESEVHRLLLDGLQTARAMLDDRCRRDHSATPVSTTAITTPLKIAWATIAGPMRRNR